MSDANKLFLSIFVILAVYITVISPSYSSEKINAGVVYEFYLDVNNQIRQESIYDVKNLPEIKDEEINIAYFKEFRPLNMLCEKNVSIVQKLPKKTFNYRQIPKEYNLSLQDRIMAASKLNPSFEDYFAQALDLKNKEKYKEALEEINKALEIDHLSAQGYFLKADILRLNKKYKESVFAYAVAIELDPYCTDAYFNIAKILESSDKKELALEYYRYAYSTNPNDYEIRNIILNYQRQGIN